MTKKKKLRCANGLWGLLLVLSILICPWKTYAQNEKKTVTGTVSDAAGPLIGVNVLEKGTTNGATTDIDGKFTLQVPADATIEFSYVGYTPVALSVKGKDQLSVLLKENQKQLEEVVVVGYGTQKKASLTGAVAAVTNDQIVTTKNENVQNMITGKLPGVRVVQKSSEPGSYSSSFDIRGMGNPLVVIDGIPRDNIQRIDPNDIESISVLKDASAAIYGVRAANGVVLITTKKGKEGKVSLEYSGNFTLQNPSGSPKSASAVDWMTLKNEKAMHNLTNPTRPFTDEQINAYRTGEMQSTDWWDEVMRTLAPQTQHSISASGGTDKLSFFASAGYLYQESFLRSNDLTYERYNVRSNITAKINDRLTVGLELSGIMDDKDSPFTGTGDVIRSMQRTPSTQPVYANNNPDYYQYGYIEGINPKAMSDSDLSGYKKTNNKWFQSAVSFTYKVPKIEGLNLKGKFSYDYEVIDKEEYQKKYNLYNYDQVTSLYTPYQQNNINKLTRYFYTKNATLYNLSLDYSHLFGDHNVSAFFAVEGSKKRGDNIFARRELNIDLPYLFAGNTLNQEGGMSNTPPDYAGGAKYEDGDLYEKVNLAWLGRVGYDYKSKYLVEASFRYDGSSLFPSNSRWGFFPSASLGWRVSEESFWQESPLAFISNFKLRGSYGKLGDDSGAQYQYLTGYNYPSIGGAGAFTQSASNLPNGYVFDGVFVNGVSNRGIPNRDITWYVAKTADIGFDLDAWNGLLGVTFDYFQRKRTGLLATRVLNFPNVVGASLPQENLESDLTRGIELQLTHRNRIAEFDYNVTGILALTRVKKLDNEMARAGNSWENYLNNNQDRYLNQMRGKEGAGRFTTYDQIANSPVYYGQGTLPGDYKYMDWNNDGRISGLDEHNYAFEDSKTPFMNFSLNLGAAWKGFDLSMLWQGTALGNVKYLEQLREPMWGADQANALDYFMDRWHPVDPTANPYDYTTIWTSGKYAYTGSLPEETSEHNVYNSAYLRLKSLELGYTLPQRWLTPLNIQGLRVYVNGYNLVTFKGMELDPEHNSENNGYTYPLNRTFSVGANVKF